MIVHLAGSIRNNHEGVKDLKKITEVIQDFGGALSHNWIEPAIIRRAMHIETPDWTTFVKDTIDALRRSDVVIIEASHYSFSQGFQMAAALNNQKPVLVISRERLKYKYLTGFTSSLLSYGTYSSEIELVKKVSSFLKKNTVHTKDLRFNIFINREILRYLNKTSKETGKNKSEIIRDIIKKNDNSRKQ